MTVRSSRSSCGTDRLKSWMIGSIATEMDSFRRFSFVMAIVASITKVIALIYVPRSGLAYRAINETTGAMVMIEARAYYLRSELISVMALLTNGRTVACKRLACDATVLVTYLASSCITLGCLSSVCVSALITAVASGVVLADSSSAAASVACGVSSVFLVDLLGFLEGFFLGAFLLPWELLEPDFFAFFGLALSLAIGSLALAKLANSIFGNRKPESAVNT